MIPGTRVVADTPAGEQAPAGSFFAATICNAPFVYAGRDHRFQAEEGGSSSLRGVIGWGFTPGSVLGFQNRWRDAYGVRFLP